MKKQFTEELILLMPDQSKPFQIKSDASKVAKYLLNWIQIETDTLLLSCQRLSPKPKESTKSMIKNY
jgi:hypothetical protein